MKTLYLHIGTPKTATSSIQAFCRLNKEKLLEYDYCFPILPKISNIGIGRNAHFLIAPSVKLKFSSRNKKHYHKQVKAGLGFIHKAFQNNNNVVLSDESLWRAINYTWENPLEILKRDADENDYQIRVIVYIRRQDAFLISNWNQRVKRNRDTISFTQCMDETLTQYPLFLDYGKALDNISDIVGKENLVVRRFEPETWVNHSIYCDFLDAIGLNPNTPCILPVEEVNPGLKGNSVELMRLLNSMSTLSSNEHAKIASYIREISADSGSNYPNNPMSPDEIKDFLTSFEESNNHVAATYIADGKPLFNDQIKDVPKWSPDNPYMWEDMVRLFIMVTRDIYQENMYLRKEISSIKKNYVTKQQFSSFKEYFKHPFRTIYNKFLRKEHNSDS